MFWVYFSGFNVPFSLIFYGLQTGKMRGDGAFLLLVFICLLGKFQFTFFHYSRTWFGIVLRYKYVRKAE